MIAGNERDGREESDGFGKVHERDGVIEVSRKHDTSTSVQIRMGLA
jgi:uncharacterized protein (UPF0335 family)